MMATSPKSTRSLSDSEESFHLGLPEECDIELSQNPSEKNSPTNEETEEDILNKIETSDENNDLLDATDDEEIYLKTEDSSIVENEIDGETSTNIAKEAVNENTSTLLLENESMNEEASSPILEVEPTIFETLQTEKIVDEAKIEAQKYTAGADYEHSIDGEFRSLYEVDNDEKAADEAMDVEEDESQEKTNSEDAEMTNLEENDKQHQENNEKPSDTIEEKELPLETSENLDENFKIPNTEELLTREKNNISEDETEDLLDVSMVRDPAEDEACAIADAIEQNLEEEEEEEKDVSSSEKEDEERMDIEQDLSETEKEIQTCLESDDKTSIENNLEENLNKTDDNNYQAESKTDSLQIDESHEDLPEFGDLEIDKMSKNSEETDIIEISEDSVAEKISSNNTNIETCEESSMNTDIPNNSEKLLTNKRTRDNSESNVSDTDDESSKKRICIENELDMNNLQINVNEADNNEPHPLQEFKYLSSFARFMQNKNLTTTLTLSDLEEYSRQKIVEALKIHSVEGIWHQKIQLLETRCEAQEKTIKQLLKHCNDLKLVNERLMADVRKQYGTRKPTVPLKITRSVGLQVRRNPCSEILSFQTRKPQNTVLISSPKNYTPKVVKPAINNTVVNTNNNNNNAIQRQISAVSLNTSPLINGATTTTTTTTTTQAQSPVISPKKSSAGKRTSNNNNNNSASKKHATESPKNEKAHNVIDLTDDDRILPGLTVLKSPNQNKPLNQNNIIAKNSLSSAMRLPPGSVITSTANNGSRQMLYVVPGIAGIDYSNIQTNGNHQPQIALVNFQTSPNGVITTTSNLNSSLTKKKHPAPLPASPRIVLDPKLKNLLPKPFLSIRKAETGIILKWLMPYKLDLYADISGYQLFAYQETNTPPNTDMWRKVGDVVALKLPMACTLTQFADNNTYYFAVRAVDIHKRCGSFSDPESIVL